MPGHKTAELCIILNAFVAVRMIGYYQEQNLSRTRLAMAQSISKLSESMDLQNIDIEMRLKAISTFVKEENLMGLKHYLDRISDKIANLNSVLKTDNAIIGALLQAKAAQADVLGIRMQTDVSTPLAGLGDKSLDVARIVGNLIDNAFDAVQLLEEEQQTVSVSIHKTGPLLRIIVQNPGRAIDADRVCKLFEAGYTTKGNGHGGLGLYIVKTLATRLGGSAEVTSNESVGNSFKITIPNC